MKISVIIPLYNEEESIEPMYRAVTDALAELSMPYEILFVDDGSRDATFATARELAGQDPRMRVIKFRKNYGQTPAMVAGIDNASGDILVTMDGDLQNDPRDIPMFLDKMQEGYDIVVGWRRRRQDKLITRKIPSKIANWLIGKVTGVPIRDNGCSLKAYRASIIKSVPLYSEMHRFIPAMLSITGVKIAEIPVQHHARQFGVSKYGLSRTFKVLSDLFGIKTIVSFAARPLLWFGGIGMTSLVISFLCLLFALPGIWSTGPASVVLPGLSLLFAVLAFFLLFAGVLCELVYKTGNLKLEALSKLTAVIE